MKLSTKCLFIQQENDMLCSKNDFVKVLPNEHLKVVEGCDYAYNNIKEIKKIIDEYIEINNV